MSELPGSAAIGIEAVEWVSERGGSLIIRVTGRWRRRRPATSGQATLVIEAEGRRHRFPALPEPPSLTGASPGMWQLRFSIPGSLAPDLGGRTWLQFGTVIVPLPAAVSSPGEPGPATADDSHASSPDPPPPAISAVPALSDPAPDDEAGRAPDLSALVADLERDLDEARAGRAELEASVAERDRARRAAEQRAHAEQALRRDLSRQLAGSVREADRARQAMGELADAEHRIRTLEDQLRDARRRSDEAEQVAAAAQAARERAQRHRVTRTGRLEGGEAARLALEQELLERRAGTGARVPAEPSARVPTRPAMMPPSVSAAHPPAGMTVELPADALVHTLRRELDARAAAEAGLRSRLVDAEARLAARVLLDQRTTALLGQLRTELEGLREAFADERSRRVQAEHQATDLGHQAAALRSRVAELELVLGGEHERTLHAHEAIGELRRALEGLRIRDPAEEPKSAEEPKPAEETKPAEAVSESGGVGPRDPAGPVEPARLNDALERLRRSVAPADAAGEPADAGLGQTARVPTTSRPALKPVFQRLTRADADAAGRLLLELLPLQHDAYPLAVSYDLVLGADQGCVCVSVLGDSPVISLQSGPRPREAVDFQVFGEPGRIARLLTSRGLRRRLGRGVARVRGRRDRVSALEALLQTPLDLQALYRAGVRVDPEAALQLVAAMVDPGWTARERFTLAHRDPAGETTFLDVSDGQPMRVVKSAPGGRIATTIMSSADDLLPVLTGENDAPERIEGDLGPLAALRGWINRAQSG